MKLTMTPAVFAATAAVFLSASTADAASSSSLRKARTQRSLAEIKMSDHLVSMTEKAKYTCTFSASWSAANHPVDYPADAHTSPPVLVAHNENYKMFTMGETVTPGVQMVAETGNPEVLMSELIDAGANVMSYIAGVPMFFAPKPMDDTMEMPMNGTMDGTGTETMEGGTRKRNLAVDSVTVDKGGDPIYDIRAQTLSSMLVFSPEHTHFTGISMLAPSPDWFSASHGTQVVADNEAGEPVWLKSFKYETLPYDAGTDSGVTFTSENMPTQPMEGVSVFTVENNDAGIFVNAARDEVLPVYGWECSIAEIMYKCEFDDECMTETEDSSAASSTTFVSGVLASAALAASYMFL